VWARLADTFAVLHLVAWLTQALIPDKALLWVVTYTCSLAIHGLLVCVLRADTISFVVDDLRCLTCWGAVNANITFLQILCLANALTIDEFLARVVAHASASATHLLREAFTGAWRADTIAITISTLW